METYRGYTIDTETKWDEWIIRDGDRVLFTADSYDEALDWIDLYAKTREFRLRLR